MLHLMSFSCGSDLNPKRPVQGLCDEHTECKSGTLCNFDYGNSGFCQDCELYTTFPACLATGFLNKKGTVNCFDKCVGMDVDNYQSSQNWIFKQYMENYYETYLTRYTYKKFFTYFMKKYSYLEQDSSRILRIPCMDVTEVRPSKRFGAVQSIRWQTLSFFSYNLAATR